MRDAEEKKTPSLEETGMSRSPFGVLSAMMPWDISEGHVFLPLLRAHHSGRAVADSAVGNVIFAHVGAVRTGTRVYGASTLCCHGNF